MIHLTALLLCYAAFVLFILGVISFSAVCTDFARSTELVVVISVADSYSRLGPSANYYQLQSLHWSGGNCGDGKRFGSK